MAEHKAGYAALIGRPNAGKSSIVNALLHFPLSIVSPVPQTTRHKVLGILNGDGFQLCLLDTPGWLDEAQDDLQRALIRVARRAVREDADIMLVVVEPGKPDPKDLEALKAAVSGPTPVVLAVNKADAAEGAAIDAAVRAWVDTLRPKACQVVSARTGKGIQALLDTLLSLLPESPPYFGPDQLSDRWERFFAAEIVRQTIFQCYQKELPHACAVEIEEFKELAGRPDRISATIYVERDGQKGILIGSGGRGMHKLRALSLKALETFLGRKAELELWVKVRKNWRRDPQAVKGFGY
jgi:GTP-binding protein Era